MTSKTIEETLEIAFDAVKSEFRFYKQVYTTVTSEIKGGKPVVHVSFKPDRWYYNMDVAVEDAKRSLEKITVIGEPSNSDLEEAQALADEDNSVWNREFQRTQAPMLFNNGIDNAVEVIASKLGVAVKDVSDYVDFTHECDLEPVTFDGVTPFPYFVADDYIEIVE